MKNLWVAGLTALVMSVAPQSTSAQECTTCELVSGMYAGFYAGGNWFVDSSYDFHAGSPGVFHHVETDSGYILGGHAGYRFCNGFRLELDIGWRDNDVDLVNSFTGSSAETPQVLASEITAVSYMANLIYECSLNFCECCVRPYFGVGFGGASTKVELHYTGFDLDDNETVFAYQLLVGVAYPLCETLDIGVEYRFFSADELSLNTMNAPYIAKDWLNCHSVMFTTKYIFGCCW